MVRMGVLEREEARTHYKKNVITKAIGVADDKTSTPDIFEIEVENGDKLLLCSDGLTNMVEDYDIKKIVKDNDSIEDAVRELIRQANENGGKDNISAILIEPEIGEEESMLEKGNFINNRYEIIGRVGAGGMSDVYKDKDHKLNRNVAIKVLKNEYSKDKNFVSKFRVEAQSAASLIDVYKRQV